MSFDVENLLISKIIYEGDIIPAIEARINEEFFTDVAHRDAWDFIHDSWKEYGEVPTSRLFKGNFPNYRLLKVDEPYEQLIDEIRERRKLLLATGMVIDINSAMRADDVEGVLEAITDGLIDIHTQVSVVRDIDLSTTTAERLERYMTFQDNPDQLVGIPTGFPTMDKATNGLQPEQLITLVGLPKRGKSLIAMCVALAAHRQGKVPFFVSFEMSNEEQALRHDAIRAGISMSALQRGRLSTSQQKRLRKMLVEMEDQHPFILSTDIEGSMTVSGLAAKVEQYKPDLLVVDGAYLMDDEYGEPKGSPQALTNITRTMKRLCQKQRIPTMITTQALTWKYKKSKGLTGDSIGYSSSFLQDSDVIFGFDDTDDEDVKLLSIIDARNCAHEEVAIRVDWDTSEFEEMGGWTPPSEAWEDDEI